MCYLSSLTSQRDHVFYFVPRILYKTARTSCKTPYAWSIIRSKREQGGYITMRHTTATHSGHVSNQATKQVATNSHTQSSGQRRTGTSGRQPVLYGPELKIIHTARTRPPAAKVAQPKHISEMIPASKVIQTTQAATATPQSLVKNHTKATQTTPQRPAHQPAMPHTTAPQKTVATHHATAQTARITPASGSAAYCVVSAQHTAPATEAAARDDLTTLSSASNHCIAARANTPHRSAYARAAWYTTQYGFCLCAIRGRTTQCRQAPQHAAAIAASACACHRASANPGRATNPADRPAHAQPCRARRPATGGAAFRSAPG